MTTSPAHAHWVQQQAGSSLRSREPTDPALRAATSPTPYPAIDLRSPQMCWEILVENARGSLTLFVPARSPRATPIDVPVDVPDRTPTSNASARTGLPMLTNT